LTKFSHVKRGLKSLIYNTINITVNTDNLGNKQIITLSYTEENIMVYSESSKIC